MLFRQSLAMPFRILLTAWCFAQFAMQVIWLSKWAMPRLMRQQGDDLEKRSSALFLAHKHVAYYLNTLGRLGLVALEFRGTPVTGPAIVVANHPSLLDFIALLRDFPNAVCLYKSQTRNNPVLSEFVNIAGYIEGMDGSRQASRRIVEECCQRLDEGHHIVFFPEGTRSKSNTSVSRFRSTGFHAAIKAGVCIQPVAIYCKPLFLGKHQKWLEFSHNPNHMIIEYMQPIEIDSLAETSRSARGLAEHVRKIIKAHLLELHQYEG